MLTISVTSPHAPSQNERIAAAVAHAGTWVAWFLAPFIVYLLERDRSRFAAHQALQALLWSICGTLVGVATCGLAIPIFMVFHVIAAVRVLEGRDYEYPLVGDLARKLASQA